MVVAIAPVGASAATLPITSGLVLRFEADNIDGSNNSTLTDGGPVNTWVDLAGAANNATSEAVSTDVRDYLGADASAGNPVALNAPKFVATTGTGAPGVLFTKTSATNITALGYRGGINNLPNHSPFTAFVVGDFNETGPARSFQFGHQGGLNTQIIGLANNGYRFNGNSKLYAENQSAPGAHIATYSMTPGTGNPVGGDGVNASYRFDGSPGTFASVGSATGTVTVLNNAANGGFAIGAGQNNNNHVIDALDGIVYAILIYNQILTSNEIVQVEEYLRQQYVIPEPASFALMGVGALFVLWQGRRRIAPRA